jgi:hypothetical protein
MRVLVAGDLRAPSDTIAQSFYDDLDKSEMKSNSIPYKGRRAAAADPSRNQERKLDGHGQRRQDVAERSD